MMGRALTLGNKNVVGGRWSVLQSLSSHQVCVNQGQRSGPCHMLDLFLHLWRLHCTLERWKMKHQQVLQKSQTNNSCHSCTSMSYSSISIPVSMIYDHCQGGFSLVCQQDYGKTPGPIFMKLNGRVEHIPRKNILHFEADSNHGADTLIIFHLALVM